MTFDIYIYFNESFTASQDRARIRVGTCEKPFHNFKQCIFYLPILKTNAQISQQSGKEQSKLLSSSGKKREGESKTGEGKEEGGHTCEILWPQWAFFENGQRNLFEGTLKEIQSQIWRYLVPVFLPSQLPELSKVFPEPTVTWRAWEPREIQKPGHKNLQNDTL